MTSRRIWLILALVALALRLPDIGNPLVDLDEQMYLLVGQRMWDGAIPYVDIWDRKPIGLFLLYAASGVLPIDAVVAYQTVALLAAIATAGVIATIVRRFADAKAALAAGILYLVWLSLIGGRGGQSPVFYDLPMVLAAWAVWQTVAGRRRGGVVAMVLVGVALQIKPTVVFEGAFFGAALLVASWRQHHSWARVSGDASLYFVAAALPTVLAAGVYVAIGHGDAWWFANVRSIFLRRVVPSEAIATRLAGQAVVLAVPLALALRGLALRCGRDRIFLGGWMASAAIGWLLVPPYFNHYALPLLVPIAIAAGMALERSALRWVAGVTGALLLWLSGYPHWHETRDVRQRLAALARAFGQDRGQGCPFVFDAPPALYTAAHACLPTRYPFPPHLTDPSEAGAIGVDPRAELARVLATRPPAIAVGRPDPRMTTILKREYRPVAGDLGVTIYRRVDIVPGTDSSAAPVRSSGPQ